MSEEILDEYEQVLNSYEIASKVDDHLRCVATTERIISHARIVNPTTRINIVTDPDDDKFIEAAIEGHADVIISQDKHLLALKEAFGVPVMDPKEFLDERLSAQRRNPFL